MILTERVAFGSTGLSVTPLALGTSGWGPLRPGETAAAGESRVAALADAFFARSLPTNVIDTSNEYGDALSEGLIGKALARAGGLPDDQLLQTKLDRRLSDGDFSGDRMWQSLEESLERLGVERLQVLFLHDPETVGFDAAMAPRGPVLALLKMKEQGLVDAVGISGGPVAMLQRFVETDLFDALITHNRYTLVDRSANALLDSATQRRMGIDNAAPYGGGILTGDARFRGTYGYRTIRPEVQAAVDSVAGLCEQFGVSLGAAALQFSLRDPRIHSTIIGATSLNRIQDTVRETAEQIPEELWTAIEAVGPDDRFALDADW